MKANKRIASFDVLRVIALLGVFFYHLSDHLAPYGYLGVVTFFVLAGYLSTRHLKEKRPIVSSLINKADKLYPPLILMLFFVSFIMIIFLPAFLENFSTQLRSSLLGFNNLQQIHLGDSYFEGQLYVKPITHLWAISLEMQFYVLFILIMGTFYHRNQKPYWLMGSLLISVISIILLFSFYSPDIDPSRIYYGLDTRLFSFTLGISGALLRNKLSPKYLLKNPYINLGLFLLSVILMMVNTSHMPIQLIMYTLLILSILMFNEEEDGVLYTLGIHPITQWICSRSYHFYLWHFPIILFTKRFLANKEIHTGVYYLLCILLCPLVTEGFFRLGQWLRIQVLRIKVKGHRVRIPTKRMLPLVLALLLLLLPWKGIYSLVGDEALTSFENKLLEEERRIQEELREERSIQIDLPDTAEVATDETILPEDAIQVAKNTYTKDDFSDSMLESFNYLNTLNDDVYLDFDDFLRYRNLPVTLLGDSIAVMSEYYFVNYLPNMVTDAEKSRLLEEAYTHYQALKQKTTVQDFLVISLGTNSYDPIADDLEKILQDRGDKPLFILNLVMPYPDNEGPRNEVIEDFAAKHNNVYLIDWYAYAKTHDEFFFEDYMHPNDLGARAFIHLITEKLVEVAKEYEAQGKLYIK